MDQGDQDAPPLQEQAHQDAPPLQEQAHQDAPPLQEQAHQDAPPRQDAVGIRRNQLIFEDVDREDEDVWPSSSDSETADSDDEHKWTRSVTHAFRYAINGEKIFSKKRTLYMCRPLRLIKCNYKMRNALMSYPSARSGHRIIASDSNLYCLGGYNPRNALSAARRGTCMLFQQLWSYNFAAKHWSLALSNKNMENMPEELASNALAWYKNVIISHGGTGYPFGETCSNDSYIYTTSDEPIVARIEATGDLPMALYGQATVIHEDYLYTIGGTTGFDYFCDVYRLNLLTKVWELVLISRPDIRDDPKGRYRHEVVYDGQRIYVLGGGSLNYVYDLQRIPVFNLKSNKWDYLDTLPDPSVLGPPKPSNAPQDNKLGYPKPRKCLSCVQHTLSNGDIEVFISGGQQADYATYFVDFWKLNLRMKQWTWIRATSYSKPLYFHSATQAGNGCMYVFGGIEYDDGNIRRRNDLYKMWMTVPKLSEMCWDAITYYNPNLNAYDSAKLLKLGIPERFVQRLAFHLPQLSNIGEFFKMNSKLPTWLNDLL